MEVTKCCSFKLYHRSGYLNLFIIISILSEGATSPKRSESLLQEALLFGFSLDAFDLDTKRFRLSPNFADFFDVFFDSREPKLNSARGIVFIAVCFWFVLFLVRVSLTK